MMPQLRAIAVLTGVASAFAQPMRGWMTCAGSTGTTISPVARLCRLPLAAADARRPLRRGMVAVCAAVWGGRWERFTCETDCEHFPETCISEHLIRTTADAMQAEGLVAAGYDYIQVDDCWAARERDAATGSIVPDPTRFPSGMKALSVRASYV
jgi:hypothetical protein